MAKLTHSTSVQIVERALRTIREPRPLSSQTRLGEILLTPHESALFRTHVHAGVKAEGFEIDLEHIPAEPHLTIDHVALAVRSLSGLAGNTGVDDESFPQGIAGDSGTDDVGGTGGDSGTDDASGPDDPSERKPWSRPGRRSN